MEPMNVLLVERDADWTHLADTAHLVGHAMLVLAQQQDETSSAFLARIRRRIARLPQHGLNSVAVLRGQHDARSSEVLLRELRLLGSAEVRMFPALGQRIEPQRDPAESIPPAAASNALSARHNPLKGLRAHAA
jgi:hypothetical protein